MSRTETRTAPVPAPRTTAPGARRRTAPDWLWAALLTLAVGLVGSGTPQMWRDEIASWSAATRDTGDLLDMLRNVDAVSGAYYLVLHGWTSLFGDSLVALRAPSALAMAGAAAFVVLTARTLFDRRTAVFAGLLFALVPVVSRYAQEARSYAFVVLAVAAATWLLLRALERPGVRRWLPYSLALCAAGLFHIVSLLVLLPHAVIVLLRARRARRWRLAVGYALAVVLALLPVLPLVLLGQSQVGRQISWLTTPHLRTIAEVWNSLFGSPLVAAGVLAAAALPLAWSRGRRPAVEIALVGALPMVGCWIVSQGSTAYFFDRYLAFTVPAWVVLAAAGLAALKPRAAGAVGLVLIVGLGATDQVQLRAALSKEKGVVGASVASVITKGYRPGDGFVPVRGHDSVYMVDYQVEYNLPDRVKLRDVFAAKSAVANDDLFPVACAQPTACLGDTRRIWVVTWSGTKDPFHKLPAAEADALRAHYKVVESTKVRGLQVTLVERNR
ncbi:glycosyltransferase family 39 protein [Streptomyces sp. NPDC051555]|uniref:glycosyltransferase family 39 protein n=1 Tax=Streptomyces sp. NPDC051555 TaxID=3365657 RepID=UPI0037B3F36A